MDGTLAFSGNLLSRVDRELTDPAWLAARRADPRGRYLLLRDLEVPVSSEEQPRLAWLAPDQLPPYESYEGDPILLGLEDGVPHFSVAVAANAIAAPADTTYLDARTLASMLPIAEAAIVAQARSMAEWHARNGFCAKCGGATTSVEGGARRACGSCETRHYPRVDPSIIVLVEREERALLAGRVGGPTGRKSCVAGFVEPGESIEEAVVREVFEETGVHVGDVQYSYSQPWPFPGVLMIGCRARARTSEIRVDGVEIGHADWYTRGQVRAALAGRSSELAVPPPLAIAHHLLKDWSAFGA
ncbi:MAG: NAD(+) diphosphatase [Chloroflexi bacterium]|nr:NAD(+) diphosphatase [Chloroflexota bacterium]MDA1147934.1 NAD(+) diphosphatase [Chloroflexota bacterium]